MKFTKNYLEDLIDNRDGRRLNLIESVVDVDMEEIAVGTASDNEFQQHLHGNFLVTTADIVGFEEMATLQHQRQVAFERII